MMHEIILGILVGLACGCLLKVMQIIIRARSK
jgi:hypothetical protein